MAYFEAKMHQIRFGWGLRPIPGRGAYSAPPGPPAGFQGPTSEGKRGEGKGSRRVKGIRGEGRKEENGKQGKGE